MQPGDSPELVKCPWCTTEFDIIPNSSASGFACPSCGQMSSYGALRNPSNRPNAVSISKWKSRATTANVYKFTIPYKYLNRAGSEEIASGTVVRIGDKILLATVAHARPKSVDKIEMIKRAGLLTPVQFTCVTHRFASSHCDVALFELDSDSLEQLRVDAATIDRIHDAGTGISTVGSRLVGYPSDYVVTDYPIPGSRGLFALGYGCETVDPERWPAITKQSGTFDADQHLVFEYDADAVDFSDPLPVPPGTPAPFGMSGGGLWQRKCAADDDQIWTAEDYFLIGIQSSKLDDKPFLKAVQIIHWLRLVADTYPELKAEIETRYPRIATV